MYSVEDLLISHGYAPSRELPAPRPESPEGRPQARTRTRTGHGLLNGCEDGPAAPARRKTPPGKGHVSDPDRRRREPPSAAEAGFSNRPALVWSAQPPPRDDPGHWRRGPEGSGLLGSRERKELGIRAMAQAHSLPAPVQEGPWEVGGRTEKVTRKAAWEEELRTNPGRWPDGSLESWSQPRQLGRQMSDGGGQRLPHNLYPLGPAEPAWTAQSKRKSRSLPRVLSPESLRYMEVPIPFSDGHVPGVPQMPPYPNCAPSLDCKRNPEKAPLPRPKFGRPIKQGGGGHGDPQASQHGAPHVSCWSKANEPRHELCGSDPGLEPPVYVPPPSYRSPPEHIPNPYLEDAAPTPSSSGHGQQPHLTEKPRLPSSGSGDEYGVGQCSPCPAGVQYIPFDDPRIRHIKLAWPHGDRQDATPEGSSCGLGPVAPPEPARNVTQLDGAGRNPRNPTPPSGDDRGLAFAEPSPQWLWGQLPRNRDNGGPPDPTDHRITRDGEHGHTEGLVSRASPHGESLCETQAKLKKSETGPELKRRSKKKVNETIFCLVSIPVKSESQLPDTDRNNNDLKQGARQVNGADKSPLSASCTDLELQALTGSLVGRPALCTQAPGEPEKDRHANDLRFLYLTGHTELTYPGVWPGHQYRDQQTQTSFPEEPKSSQQPTELGAAGHVAPTPRRADPAASDPGTHTVACASRDHAQNLQGQASPLSPASNSAFSRASSSSSSTTWAPAAKAGPSVDGRAPGASPAPQPEVVKGETAAGSCNSQQPFGQFLLKPVSRRPWDLISQLESFNKELQEEEESHPDSDGRRGSGSEGSEGQGPWEDGDPSLEKHPGFPESHREERAERQPKAWGPQHPEFRSGGAKSQSGGWSEQVAPGWPQACPQACPRSPRGPPQAEDSRGAVFLAADGGAITEKRDQAEGRSAREPVHSPSPPRRAESSRASDAWPAAPACAAGLREPTRDASALRVSGAAPPEAGETPAPLPLAARSRGLSAPDLRCVGLREQHPIGSDGSWGDSSAAEIPPGETLQARAARILGIEVAVESLLPDSSRTRQSQRPEPPREASQASSAPSDGPTATADAFYGRRKCGWTESPLFVGEREGTRRAPPAPEPSAADGVLAGQVPSPEPQPDGLEPKPSECRAGGLAPSFRSTLFHVIERTPGAAGSEKRLRSPSKVIESLQEKLAAPPRRADPSRLMRMKEVSSVSRMRCLSFQSADRAAEEAGQPAGCGSPRGGDRAHPRGLSSAPARGGVSWEDLGRPAAQRDRIASEDSWCPEAYDPSRVERV